MRFLIFILTFTLLLWAEGYKEIKEFYGDLDNDGLKEKVTWEKFITTEVGDYYQLVVYDYDGSVLWRGPKSTNIDSPFCIAALYYGDSTPQALADIDLDGKLELLIPPIQSDVSPTWYKRLKWVGNKFTPMREALLKYNPYNQEMPLKWVYKPIPLYSFWVMYIRNYKNNLLKIFITGFYPDGKSDFGEAIYKPTFNGGEIVKWITPLKGPGHNYVKFSYIATIGKRDHFNFKGKRLNRLIDLIIQDRANFYRDIRDLKDQSDPVFALKKEREDLESYTIIPVGCSYKHLKNVVLNSTPTLKITVDKNSGVLKIKILKNGVSSSNIEFSYVAKISTKDHFNSRGVRLKTIHAILQQDRANLHKGKGDSLDTYDRYFRTKAQRAKIKNYRIVPIDTSYRRLKNEIINKTPLIGVKVYSNKLAIKILKP